MEYLFFFMWFVIMVLLTFRVWRAHTALKRYLKTTDSVGLRELPKS